MSALKMFEVKFLLSDGNLVAKLIFDEEDKDNLEIASIAMNLVKTEEQQKKYVKFIGESVEQSLLDSGLKELLVESGATIKGEVH